MVEMKSRHFLNPDLEPEIEIKVVLRAQHAKTLLRHAELRSMAPVELFADLIEVIFTDDLIDAVLDDAE